MTTRNRIARLHGEACRRIVIDALGPQEAEAAQLFAAALEKDVRTDMPFELVLELGVLDDEAVIDYARSHIEPDIRGRLALAGRLPS